MDPIKEAPKETSEPLNLSNFSLKDTSNLVVRETKTTIKNSRKFRDGSIHQKANTSSTKSATCPSAPTG